MNTNRNTVKHTENGGLKNNSRYLDDYPDVLKPEECMIILSIGRNAIYKLLKNNTLPSVKIGKQYRIPKSYLQKYLEMGYNTSGVDNSVTPTDIAAV